MFKYIDTPKLVAFYLREFSATSAWQPSILYKFVFCLCLPFISQRFREARLKALAIAECTQSKDQIVLLLKQLCKQDMYDPNEVELDIEITEPSDAYMTMYDYDLERDSDSGGSEDYDFCFPYGSGDDNPIVPFGYPYNTVEIKIRGEVTDAQKYALEAYLKLLIPFYVKYTIFYL